MKVVNLIQAGIQSMPEQLKLTVDGVSFMTSVLAIAEVITGVMGALGATLSVAWGIWRLYNEYLDTKKKKK